MIQQFDYWKNGKSWTLYELAKTVFILVRIQRIKLLYQRDIIPYYSTIHNDHLIASVSIIACMNKKKCNSRIPLGHTVI